MKTRTMVYFDTEEHRRLRAEAGKHGISMAELLRRLVRQYFEQSTKRFAPRAPLPKIVGLGSSGRRDISEKHDEYLGKALRHEHSR